MDLQVEKNYIKEVQNENLEKYIYLYDSNVESVYTFVKRRVLDQKSVEKIVENVFFDAFLKIKDIKKDVLFCVWLYSLAKKRIREFVEFNKVTQDLGVILDENDEEEIIEIGDKAKKIFNKLSFEEREILRLKFFEEVSDGDIGFILNQGPEAIGPRIYRVLKRTHFLLFGESDERQGIYFGELSGFLSKLKEIEKIELNGLFKLQLRSNILKKIERKDVAIEVEEIKTIDNETQKPKKDIGSNDPAKIFVQAVKEMSEEERKSWSKGVPKKNKEPERVYNIVSKWRYVFIVAPLFVFVFTLSFVLSKVNDYLQDGCDYQTIYLDGLIEEEAIFIQEDFNKRLCETFNVNYVIAGKIYEEKLLVRVDLYEYVHKYILVSRNGNWFIEKYEKHTYSHEESGKISRNT